MYICPAQTPTCSYSITDSPFLFRDRKIAGTDSFIDSMLSTVLLLRLCFWHAYLRVDPYTLHPVPHTLNSMSHTLNPLPYILRP